jgi:hypothetical protein
MSKHERQPFFRAPPAHSSTLYEQRSVSPDSGAYSTTTYAGAALSAFPGARIALSADGRAAASCCRAMPWSVGITHSPVLGLNIRHP